MKPNPHRKRAHEVMQRDTVIHHEIVHYEII
jgi:hypothetical protein